MKLKSHLFYLGIIIGTSGLFTVSLFLLVPAGRASEVDSVAATDAASVAPTDVASMAPTDAVSVAPTGVAPVAPTDVSPVAPTDVAPVAVTEVSPETAEDDPVAPETTMEFPARKNKRENDKDK